MPEPGRSAVSDSPEIVELSRAGMSEPGSSATSDTTPEHTIVEHTIDDDGDDRGSAGARGSMCKGEVK